jgi:hypothetical protein
VIVSRIRVGSSQSTLAAIAGKELFVLTFASGLHTGFRFVFARHKFATQASTAITLRCHAKPPPSPLPAKDLSKR